MISEEVFYWQIQWAGRWMLTRRRFSEVEIRKEHPEKEVREVAEHGFPEPEH